MSQVFSVCFLFLLLIVGGYGNAQIQKVDSLKRLLTTSDTLSEVYALNLFNICNDLLEYNPDAALPYCLQAAQVPHENDSLLAQVYIKTATAYSHKAVYDKSMELALKGLEIGERINDTLIIFDAHTNLGIDLFIQEDYPRAREHFDLAERLIFQYGDSARLGHAINNVGLVVGYLEGYQQEIDKYVRAREIFRLIGNQEGFANTVMNLGTAYNSLGKYDEAISAFNQALSIYQVLQYSAAEEQAYLNLGETYLDQKEFEKALLATYKALEISKAYNYKLDELYSLELLSKIHAGLNRYDSAYFYNLKSISIKDSLFNLEKENIRSEMEAKYETEKKEQTILQLQQDTLIKDLQVQQEKQWRNNLVMLAGSLGIIAILFYSRFRNKKKATEELNQKNDELKKLNGFKDRLFTVISHDLKSPLSAFNNLTRSLADNVKNISPSEIEEYLRNLNQSSMDLSRLLNNLLEWALSQTGAIAYQPESINCKLVMEEVAAQLGPTISERKILLEYFVPSELTAHADKNMVIIVLRNLLSNAIKFSDMETTITLFAGKKDGIITLGVKDHGVGISTEDQQKLFDASADVHSVGASTEKGTGIGLILCKDLVERNGGNIYVESKLGEGSNFYFSLPEFKQ
ncbi:MAG TPA: tetratricopeptide repeat-containing sensor histidine kinase [Cyclobacteriaceae bacterium]|nr:tetratricopeptide repeat-containing sensor histidine kinase [Cyclobacteriaceae bacterium]